jgi:hypothetical protein
MRNAGTCRAAARRSNRKVTPCVRQRTPRPCSSKLFQTTSRSRRAIRPYRSASRSRTTRPPATSGHVVHSRILESPQSPQSAETAAPADDLAGVPLPSIAVTAQPKEVRKRDAGQAVVTGENSRRRRRSVGMPARRTVHAPLAGVAADFRAVGCIPLTQGLKTAFSAAEPEPGREKEGEAETEQTLPRARRRHSRRCNLFRQLSEVLRTRGPL